MSTFSSTSRTVAIVTAIVGGVILAGVGGTAALATVSAARAGEAGPSFQSLDVAGVTEVKVDSSAAEFTLEYGDVSKAELDIEGESRNRWVMRRDGDELVVGTKRGLWNICIGWCGSREQRVTLTLPRPLEGRIDVDLDVSAGSLTARGGFKDAELDVSAGTLRFEGTASSLSTDVSAGRADVVAADVRRAEFEVSAGKLFAKLSGGQPEEVRLDVSAGSADITLPGGAYDVRKDVSAGSFDNLLDVSSKSSHRVDVDVSAGSAKLR